MRQLIIITCVFLLSLDVPAQEIKVPYYISGEHPRLLTHGDAGKMALQQALETNAAAKENYDDVVASLQPVLKEVEKDSTWLLSRLQMYWNSHYSDVFIKNGVYQYGSGKAPVPTVRFTGTRDVVTNYARPKLEDIKPFMDDAGKICMLNKSIAGSPLEWVDQSKTGRNIESINQQIVELAKNAAFVYWYTGDEKYAKLAFNVFDTYMTGMYYRNEPIDLNHGHDQTLVGLQSFEVIHEDIVIPLSIGYDFLHEYIQENHSAKSVIYKETFSKWADIIIKNGVSFNNWDLIEARFVAYIALVLENDNFYADKKGCQYYLNRILNINATRQWSLKDLMAYGFDANTGIWNECPGYSQNVVSDFTDFISLFGKTLDTDIQPSMLRVTKAVEALPQYLFPNGNIVAFGDTHYGKLRTSSIENMIRNAQSFAKKDQEIFFTKELKMIQGFSKNNLHESFGGRGLNALFQDRALQLNDTIKAALPKDFITPLFYAPNVSWLVQRSGYDAKRALMISQAGSYGNHQHANGIAMELYGKGVVLAPEGGIGTSYLSGDYAEYYSQFPAHNTVCVDGISSYPVMKSNHGFEVKGNYPASNQKENYFPLLTFSDIYFLEPETNSDQQRTMGIIRTTDTTAFYIDIFRSKRKNGKERFHDYIYHNIGQDLVLTDANKKPLILSKTDKPTFADVNIMGFDYWYNNQSVITSNDFKADFRLGVQGRDSILMHMWMKGDANREVFAVLAPKSTAYGRDDMLPRDIEELPLPTVMVRQNGEAWNHPFIAVYEPANGSNETAIKSIQSFKPINAPADFAGIEIASKNGTTNYVFSSATEKKINYLDFTVSGSYAVIAVSNKSVDYLFVGNGGLVKVSGWSIVSQEKTTAALKVDRDAIWFTSDKLTALSIPQEFVTQNHAEVLYINAGNKTIAVKGIKKQENDKIIYTYTMPVMEYSRLSFTK